MMTKKILWLLIALWSLGSWAHATDLVTLEDFLVTYVDHFDNDIPSSYQYIQLYFKDIEVWSELYTAMQKAVYFNMIENLPISIRTSTPMTRNNIATIMQVHRWKQSRTSDNYITKKELQTLIDRLPYYRDFYCQTKKTIQTVDISSFTITKNEKFPILDDVYHKLTTSYLYKDTLTSDQLVTAAIQGMTSQVGDEYTTYMKPTENKNFNTAMENEYTGIGIVLEVSDKWLVVVSPFRDSPAYKAGIKPWDIITHADGKDIRPYGEKATQFILGPADTSVTLTILRGEETFDLTIIRKKVTIEIVQDRLLEDGSYYLSLLNFGYKSADVVEEALKRFQKTSATKLILDLRNNPGWSVADVEKMLDMFLPAGTKTYRMRAIDSSYAYVTKMADTRIQNKQIIILINKWSASASEILAQILKEQWVAIIVGQKSFGKGTAQSLVDYVDGSSLKYTIYEREWIISWISIHKTWVQPNHEIANDKNTTEDEQLQFAQRL